jgi:hypothetical protein
MAAFSTEIPLKFPYPNYMYTMNKNKGAEIISFFVSR